MKYIVKFSLAALVLMLPNMTFAYNYEWCHKKIVNLEKQLGYAQQYGNYNRIRGLERALMNVHTKCDVVSGYSDGVYEDYSDFYRDDRRYDLKDKILNQKEKVLEAEYEVKKAKLKGDPKKIAEKELKLQERQAKLKLYEDELGITK